VWKLEALATSEVRAAVAEAGVRLVGFSFDQERNAESAV